MDVPQVGRSPRTVPSPLRPPSEQLPPQYSSAYPPTSQHTLVSDRHHPAAFPTPQVHSTHAPNTYLTQPPVPPRAPTTHSGPPPSRVQRSVTMSSPGLYGDSQVSRGHYPNSDLQAPVMSLSQSHPGMPGATLIPSGRRRNQDDSDDERDWNDHDTSAMHRNDTIPKGRPDRPLVGILNPRNRPAAGAHGSANSSASGTFARLLNRVHHGGHSSSSNQTQTQAAQVIPPQPITYRCRWHQCQTTIAGDTAARYSGFCCSSHLDLGIRHRIVTLCPQCRQRVCPDGQAFCRAECANSSGRH